MLLPVIVLLVIAVAGSVAAWAYFRVEGLGRRGWPLVACRTVALSAIGILLLDLSCAVRPFDRRPLVLLDGSLSMDAAGGTWVAARDSARHWGTVRTFGDDRLSDSLPDRGSSRLLPALRAAQADGRPVTVVTDGELDDAADLPADLRDATRIRGFPRAPVTDFAVTELDAPSLTGLDDTLTVAVTAGRWNRAADSAVVTLFSERVMGRRTVHFGGGGTASAQFAVTARALGAGDHLLRARVDGAGDREPRDDEQWALVHVAPTPGIVIVADPPDWDSRQLYRTLREVADVPVRGYARLGSSWRTMDALASVTDAAVETAARGADLLVIKGKGARVRAGRMATWIWRSGESGSPPAAGDWYADSGDLSPLSGAWVGTPFDSLPPLVEVAAAAPAAHDWVALTARQDRRGGAHPVIFGGDSSGRRWMDVAGDGFWRWAFQGGPAEQAYRTWVATSVSWLLGGTDPRLGVARPVQSVAPRGLPLIFEWIGKGNPGPVAIYWTDDSASGSDTLRFDGAGRADLRLPVGLFHYRLGSGGNGVVAVEPWSREWIPRPTTIATHDGAAVGRSTARMAARDRLWIFALILLALAIEWTLRRRLGLR